MNLLAAKSLLMSDRMDWRKPHLHWVANRFYRPFASLRGRSRDDRQQDDALTRAHRK